jgi:hypothetical protein
MRTLVRLAAVGICVLGGAAAAAAGPREDALAVVEQALKAHGGEEAMAKAQTAARTGAGVRVLAGKETPFTEEAVYDLPERMRSAVAVDKQVKVVVVVNADKGWTSAGGPAAEMGDERLKEEQEELHVLWLATLAPLKKAAVELAPLPEGAVDGKPALGVKASVKGYGDVKLWFDKATKLLVKAERRTQEEGQAADKEYLLGDPKDFDGAKLPTRLTALVGGKKMMEYTSLSYKLLRKADEGAFARP